MKIAMLVPDDRDELRRYADPEPYVGPAPSALLEGLAKKTECEIHIVCCIQKPLRAPRKLADNIYYHSVIVPKWGWMRGAYLGCVLAIRRKLREIKPDLVHGQGTERYCALAAVFSGCPNVLTIHGNMRQLARTGKARPFSFAWLAARFEHVALARTGGVICNSLHTQRLVGGLAAATWLVPNAVRGNFFSAQRVRPSSGPAVILNIGWITPNKSQNDILDVAARLHQRHVAFELHFIGKLDESVPYGRLFRARIKEAEKEGYARYLGQKSEAELIEIMDAASGLIHAPVEEAFGLVAAEGLARNLKFFGARVGGLTDIASGAEGAELFEPGDWSAAEESIFRWIKSGHPKPTQAARQMRDRYPSDLIARRHLEIYREVFQGMQTGAKSVTLPDVSDKNEEIRSLRR
jgi:glycosyltransferase involved in cell wall biosynthesis